MSAALTFFTSELLYFLVFALNIVMVVSVVAWLFFTQNEYVKTYFELIKTYAKHLAFTVVTVSTLGSLYFSEIMNYAPCPLCWYQRIFMYPLAILFGLDLLKGWKTSWRYGLPLAFIGGAIALYHTGLHQLVRFGGEAVSCGSDNVPCSAFNAMNYGYITIPAMALTGFLAVILVYYVKENWGGAE